MSELKVRVTRIHLTPDDIFSERAFSIEIDDEGGGEFIVVRNGEGYIGIDASEWSDLRDAIDLMFGNVRVED